MACSFGKLLFVLPYCLYIVSGDPPTQSARDPLSIYNLRRGHYIPSIPLRKSGIASSSVQCATQGFRAMYQKGGNAVDGAIVTLLCDGVISFQGMGIGGGFLMTIWNATEKKAYFLNAREYAPAAASERMFTPDNEHHAKFGAKAIAIPGEIAGYWEVHQKFGRLNWSNLFTDVIDMCENGVIVTPYIKDDINKVIKALRSNKKVESLIKNLEIDNNFNLEFVNVGDVIKRPKLAETLKKIRDHGKKVFYEGEIAEALTRDIQEAGGIITMDDFKNYEVAWKDPVTTTIKNKILYSAPTPGSGANLIFMLNILEKLIPVENGKSEKIMWQRIAETLKWGYARRNELGDFVERPEYENKKTSEECLSDDNIKYELLKQNNKSYDKDCLISVTFNKLLSKEYADQVRALIDDNRTWNDYGHYNVTYKITDDYGTAHTSVLDADGSAVSVTSTINYLFGSIIVSKSTGIILNNEMDDYSYPGIKNSFDVEPSPFNYVRDNNKDHLRPISSMVPTIILNEDQTVRLVIGSAGGTKITSGVTQGIIHNLFLGKSIKDSLLEPRIHHNLWPMALQVEDAFKERKKDIWNYLENAGHTMGKWLIMNNTLAAIAVDDSGWTEASGDVRRLGGAYGY